MNRAFAIVPMTMCFACTGYMRAERFEKPREHVRSFYEFTLCQEP